MSTPVITPFRPPEPAAASRNGSTPPPACKPEVMTITPDLAREWTALNTRNRAVRYAKVAQYARDMRAGTWMLNGETVKIAADGTILDGQHRLYACIEAEVPFESIVIRGLPLAAQDTIDTGMARKMGDQLSLKGEENANILASIARWSFKWLRGIKMTGEREQEPSHAEMLALIDAEPRLREAASWAAASRGRFRAVPPSVWGIAWLVFHGIDWASAEVFLQKAATGEDCPAGHPALAFRNRILRARDIGERLNQYEMFGCLIMAWNAFREDRPLTKIVPPRGGFTPKTYPEPK